MKIPMEIPEAYESATKEIIDFECEAEMVRYLHAGYFATYVSILYLMQTAQPNDNRIGVEI